MSEDTPRAEPPTTIPPTPQASHPVTPKPHPEPAPAPAGDPHRAAHVGKSDRHAVKADEIERLKQEAKQAHERYLRTLAEFENTKKRLHREKEEFVKYASETVVRELLPIVDSLGQALVAVDQQADPQAIVKGVHLIYRQLLGLLEKEGVKRIPSVGETFDPHTHEAVAQVESTDGTPDERVVEEVQAGYTMHGKVIRPAMVKVAKKGSPQSIVHSPQNEDNSGQGT